MSGPQRKLSKSQELLKAPGQYMQISHWQVCSVWDPVDCLDRQRWLLPAAAGRGRLLCWVDRGKIMMCFLSADYGVIPNRKFPMGNSEHRNTWFLCLALEEMMDGQMPRILFGSSVQTWGLQKCCSFCVWDLALALIGVTPQLFIHICPFIARKLSLSTFFFF